MSPHPAELRPVPPAPQAPLALRIGFWICIAISVAVVLRRIASLISGPRSAAPQLASLDQAFSSHAALTLAHIIPALLFVLIAPFIVFRPQSRVRRAQRIFFPLGVVVALTAYAMSAYSIGGWTERSAVFLFDSLFLFSLLCAWIYRRHSNLVLARRWQLRSIAILLGIATTRPVMGIFFATARLTHLVPQQFFGIAFWIGFSINVLIFELWIHSPDRRQAVRLSSAIPT